MDEQVKVPEFKKKFLHDNFIMYEKMTVIIWLFSENTLLYAHFLDGKNCSTNIQVYKADNFPQNNIRIISMEKLFNIPYRH